jgi:caffeoyl-CoA O-methyltransferase
MPVPPKNLALTDAHYRYIRYCQSHAGDPILAELREATAGLGDIGAMQIAEEQGALLTVLAGAPGVREALEIGTFTGYSSICLARGLPPDGRLLCCDQSDEWTSIAREFWKKAGVADRVELRLGPAAATLAALEADRRFDFAFVDADKTGYDAYFEAVLPRMRPGGLIAFDNMLQHGRILEPEGESARAIDALNRKLATDPRVVSVLIPIGDGIMLCRKR